MKTAFHKSSIPFTQIFFARDLREKHFDPIWHSHSEFQLFVVLEGTGTRFIGDSIKRFHPGELILTGPHLPHLWRSDEAYFEKNSNLKTRGIVVYLNEHFLGEHLLEKEEMLSIKKLFHKSMMGLDFYGDKKIQVITMLHELVLLTGLESVILLLKILQILSESKQYHFISHTSYEDPFKQSETDRINTVFDYVMKNFRKKILLEEIAELVHMTPTSFSRYFTMKNNKTFSAFISEIRIKHACKLLTETEHQISDICYDCGFNTLSNFNKQFKEVMFKIPSAYRKEFLTI
ncbi:MAG: AraC family transcriptional regulator [Chitinophagaceae bacterium]